MAYCVSGGFEMVPSHGYLEVGQPMPLTEETDRERMKDTERERERQREREREKERENVGKNVSI